MAINRYQTELSTTQRALFEAADNSIRRTFTGEVKIQVIAGKAVSISTVKDDEGEYPSK